MPKIKTHSGLKKVLRKRKNDVMIGKPGRRHNTGDKSASYNRAGRKGNNLSKADRNRLKNLI